jgi:hypothetical protein
VQKAYDWVVWIVPKVEKFPKFSRFSIGQSLLTASYPRSSAFIGGSQY